MTIDHFFNRMRGKTVGFCGIGRSNLPLMELFVRYGAIVSARDKSPSLGENGALLQQLGVKTVLGEGYLANITEDILFRAPGMPYFLPELTAARERGCVVTSEMEVFFDLCPCKIYAITGSDGKTTTTSVIGAFLRAAGKTVHMGGNIGNPLLPEIFTIRESDVAVVELSSFQLISMRRGPDVAVITNLAPNHLDVHKDMDEYIEAKKNVFTHQNAFSRTVLNRDNAVVAPFKPEVRGDCFEFSRREKLGRGAYASEGEIYAGGQYLMDTADIKIPGNHNVENFLAAICAVWGEVAPEHIVQVAKTFGGVAHRTELVRELAGVKYYNDSIASSPSRAMSGTLSLYDKKIIMIAGGADKNVPFDQLGTVICQKVKNLILIKPEKALPGFKASAADKIRDAVMRAGGTKITYLTTMEAAVNAARELAENGDIVSLCPACTAFDMYQNFEVRGNHYRELVMQLDEPYSAHQEREI